MLCFAVQDSWFISFFSKNYFCRLSWGMNIRFWILKVTNSLRKIYWKPMAKEIDNYLIFYFKNTLYTRNLNSSLKGTDFTCTQCIINNKNLECFTFSLIFQFFVWVLLKLTKFKLCYRPVHVTFVRISFSGPGKFQLFWGNVNYSRVHVSFRLVLAEQFLK